MAEQGGTRGGTRQGTLGPGRPPLGGSPAQAPGSAALSEGRWFVVWTNPNCDERAVRSIERAGFEARVLTWRKLVRHNRSKQEFWKIRRLLPRYVFVRLPTIGAAGLVRNCDGVDSFLHVQGRPLAITADQMGRLVGIEASEEFEQDVPPPPPRPVFALGDEVLVLEGIAEGRKAKVVQLHGKGAVAIELELDEMLDALWRARPVRIAVDLLEKAN